MEQSNCMPIIGQFEFGDAQEVAVLDLVATLENALDGVLARHPGHRAYLLDVLPDLAILESLRNAPLPEQASPEVRRGIERALESIGMRHAV
jgi:hypothetical protein